MNRFLAWLKSKNINTHTVGAALLVAATYLTTHQEARDFLMQAFAAHPKIALDLIALAGLAFKYSHSSNQKQLGE